MENKTNVSLLLGRASVRYMWIDRAPRVWRWCAHSHVCMRNIEDRVALMQMLVARTKKVCRTPEQFAIGRAWVSSTWSTNGKKWLCVRACEQCVCVYYTSIDGIPFRLITSKWVIFLLLAAVVSSLPPPLPPRRVFAYRKLCAMYRTLLRAPSMMRVQIRTFDRSVIHGAEIVNIRLAVVLSLGARWGWTRTGAETKNIGNTKKTCKKEENWSDYQ